MEDSLGLYLEGNIHKGIFILPLRWSSKHKHWLWWSEVKVAQSCLTLCTPWTVVHGILQARILEWVAVSFSRGSSQPRDQTQVSHIAGGFFTSWATWECYQKQELKDNGDCRGWSMAVSRKAGGMRIPVCFNTHPICNNKHLLSNWFSPPEGRDHVCVVHHPLLSTWASAGPSRHSENSEESLTPKDDVCLWLKGRYLFLLRRHERELRKGEMWGSFQPIHFLCEMKEWKKKGELIG